MLDAVYLGLYRAFHFLLRVLPRGFRRKVISLLASLAYSVSRKHQEIIDYNLDLAYNHTLDQEEKRKIGKAAFENLVDTVFGIMERDGASPQKVLENVSFKGEEIVRNYQEEGKNFILVTGHYGNWELLSQSIALKFDLALVGVGRKLDSAVMDRVLKENREQFNVEMVYKKGALKGCIDAIRAKKTVGILTDQHIRKNQSIDVTFFGHRATHTPLASILSRKFGLDMIPAYIHTEDYGHYTVTIYEPIKTRKTENQEEDLAILTQAQADRMEQVIRQDPRQWFWMHDRWRHFKKKRRK